MGRTTCKQHLLCQIWHDVANCSIFSGRLIDIFTQASRRSVCTVVCVLFDTTWNHHIWIQFIGMRVKIEHTTSTENLLAKNSRNTDIRDQTSQLYSYARAGNSLLHRIVFQIYRPIASFSQIHARPPSFYLLIVVLFTEMSRTVLCNLPLVVMVLSKFFGYNTNCLSFQNWRV